MHKFKFNLPIEALFILKKLKDNGFDAYLVGGAVRDLILLETKKQPIKIYDFDFTTNATPQEILKIFENSFYENDFGCVNISEKQLRMNINKDFEAEFSIPLYETYKTKQYIDLTKIKKPHESIKELVKDLDNEYKKNIIFEITTFRTNEIYSNFRKPNPKNLKWGKSIYEDLQRRDFTINALAINIKKHKLDEIFSNKKLLSFYSFKENDYEIIDKFDGIKDLNNKIIRSIGDPDKRLNEDALRILRAIRFSCQLDMKIDNDLDRSIKVNTHLLKQISIERITIEFFKILLLKNSDKAIQLLDKYHILDFLLPELLETKGVKQSGHHIYDVWTHSLLSLKNCPSDDPITKLAALIHDIGKPKTQKIINGQITFYNHEVVGAQLSKTIAKRFKLSNKQKEKLYLLVRNHMFYYQPYNTDAAIRRLIKRINIKYLNDLFAIREGDRLGSGSKQTSWRLEELKKRIYEQLNQPFDLKDLDINGHDLIQHFNLKPSKLIGQTLNYLMEKVLDDPSLNKKQTLLKLSKEFIFSSKKPEEELQENY